MSQKPTPPGPSREEYRRRRARVDAQLERAAMVLPAGHLTTYAHDTDNRFRPDGNFRYLTGFPEPDAIGVWRPAAEHPFTLFVPPRDPEKEAWTGRRLGPEGAISEHDADAAYPLELLDQRLPQLLDGCERVYYEPWRDAALDQSMRTALQFLRSKERFGHAGPQALVHPGAILDELRLFKTAEELALLTRACEISAAGHRAALRVARPGVGEWQIQAAIESTFRELGAHGPGYGTIVGAGGNGCILHYVENNHLVGEQDLVLVDAGAEYGGYNGDITRTFPASGRFTAAQHALYDVVLAALDRAIAATRPGATLDSLHEAALEVLVQGLIDLRLLHVSYDEALERKLYNRYYMHRTSHWLGIDVHDVGRYRVEGSSRRLAPGMVLTVEPGLYIEPQDQDAPEALRGQSVRLEDNLVVTADGHRNLTRGAIPVRADEVAQLVGR